jgi:hypothetical protein
MFGKQRQLLLPPVIFIENLNRTDPCLALAVIDLAKI